MRSISTVLQRISRRICQWPSLFWGLGVIHLLAFAPLCAETPEKLFHTALILEKGAGEPERAIAQYEAVMAQYEVGQTNQQLAMRAQERLIFLRRVLGLKPIANNPNARSETLSEVPLTNRRLVAFREAFGIAPPGRASVRAVQTGSALEATGGLAKKIQGFNAVGFRETDARTVFDPQQTPIAMTHLHNRVLAIQKALGIQGLAEIYRLSYEKRQARRPVHSVDFYQAGLIAEREHGDIKTAIEAYQQAIQNASPQMKRHIQNRLHGLKTDL